MHPLAYLNYVIRTFSLPTAVKAEPWSSYQSIAVNITHLPCKTNGQKGILRKIQYVQMQGINSVVLVHKRTIPIERSPLVSEASANFSG
jgi:hypothetical protein